MRRRKVAAVFSTLLLTANATMPISVALASELDPIQVESMVEDALQTYTKITYDGSSQKVDIEENVTLSLLGWKDETEAVVLGKLTFIDAAGLEVERELEIAKFAELLPFETTPLDLVHFSVVKGEEFSTAEIAPVVAVEQFLPVLWNENRTLQEQLAKIDEEGTILSWEEAVQYLDAEGAAISAEAYLALNEVVEEAVLEEEEFVEEAAEVVGPEVAPASEPMFQTFMTPSVVAVPGVSYSTHVQNTGWMADSKNGALSGTVGAAKRLEAIKIQLEGIQGLNVEYATHIQNYGWSHYAKSGEMSGTQGEAKRLEAIKIRLSGEAASAYDVYYRVHSEAFGWLDWAKNDEPSGTEGMALRLEAIEIKLVEKGQPAPGETAEPFVQKPGILYDSYTQNAGWNGTISENGVSGVVDQGLGLEAIKLDTNITTIGVRYKTHIQDVGWMDWVNSNHVSGLPGSSKRLEAIQMELTGIQAQNYDIYYRVFVRNLGWLGWAKNGAQAGSEGFGYPAEAYEVKIVPAGTTFATGGAAYRVVDKTSVVYSPHVEKLGWLAASSNGQTAGTVGQALRMEALTVELQLDQFEGDISYRTHVENYGWQEPVYNGSLAGTAGEGKRVEAIQLKLHGEVGAQYDIYYRTHIESYGWLGWAKNGMPSGSEGQAKRIESIEIRLFEKDKGPDVSESAAFVKGTPEDNRNVIFLDVGHGGADPGAQYHNVDEKDLNLQMAFRIQRDLENAGYVVIMSRTDDTYMDYRTERARVANASGADIFLSLHNNAMWGDHMQGVNGIETFYYEYDPDYEPAINPIMHNDPERIKRSALLAELIHKNLIAETGAFDRGVRRDTFAVLRETEIPAVLLEFGFMSNLAELSKLVTADYQDQLAQAVLAGVNAYFDVY